MEEDTNIIEEILSTAALSYEDRIRFKEIGRPTPQIIVSQKGQSRAETYNRNFNVSSYDKYPWLAGYKDSMYCFPCLLFCIKVGVANPWLTGFQTISRLKEKSSIHSRSKKHIENRVSYKSLGTICIQRSLSTAYDQSIRDHNNLVEKKGQFSAR